MNLRILLAAVNAAGSDSQDMLFLRDVLSELEGREYWSDWVHLETVEAADWKAAEALLQPEPPESAPIDLVLLDLNLYEPVRGPLAASRVEARRTAQGTEIFRRAKAAAPQVPVILLVDPQDITLAEFLLREGAQDFLLKSQIDCAPLAHAIRNAIERHRYLESARAAGMTDPLTGLLNRPAFLALAERDRQLALATRRRILLAIGEPAREEPAREEPATREEPTNGEDAAPEGAPAAASSDTPHGLGQERDLALIRIAEQLRAAAGPTDLIARIGEDRFGVIVCETGPLNWGAAWTRLQTASAAAHLTIGAAEFDPEQPATLDTLLEQAERELAPVAAAARR